MKKLVIFCGIFAFLIPLSNCKKDEATPEKCTPPAPPKATNNGPLAIGDTLKFTAVSIPGASYLWSNSKGVVISTEQNPSFIYNDSSKAGEYTVTATVGECTSEAYHTYVSGTNITATNKVEITTGAAPKIILNLHASDFMYYGAPIIAAYEWKGPNGFTSTEKDPILNNVTIDAAGTYSVTATAVNNGKKSNEATTTVFITPLAVGVSSNSSVAFPTAVGTTLNLTAPTITGATSYNWTGPNKFSSTLQNPSIANVTKAEEGTYSFYYTLTSNNVKSQVSTTIVAIKYSNSGCGGQTSVTHKGLTYGAIEIGTQCWLKENLKNNSIDSLTWSEMNTNTINVVNNQGACPTGWHLPDDAMWKELAVFVNGDGNQLKEIGQGSGAGTGTDTWDFSAILQLGPASNKTSIFWSTTQASSAPRYMQLYETTPLIYYSTGNPNRKYSVRCIKD